MFRGLCIGAGYFSQFHLDAWRRIDGVDIVGICDVDQTKAERSAAEFGVPQVFTDTVSAIEQLRPDFVDLITRPDNHLDLVRQAVAGGVAIICQKPLAVDFETSRAIVTTAARAGVPLMVHENFRFQPWYREVKRLLDDGTIGSRLHGINFHCRPGDGWGLDAYLGRQPYFREMKRLLVYETAVHFIDTYRYLGGEVDEVYAVLRRLNPVIQGEDAALLTFRFSSGAIGVWDGNRYNEDSAADPRYTFGRLLVEGDGGSIRFDTEGRMFVKPLGQPEYEHSYHHERRGFAADCVFTTQRHFIEHLTTDRQFETSGAEYLKTLAVQQAVYDSAAQNLPVQVAGIESLIGGSRSATELKDT